MALLDAVPCNIGPRERAVRLIVGIALLLVSVTDNVGFGGTLVQIVIGVVGAGLAGSAYLRFCPVYFFTGRGSHNDGE